MQLNIYLQIRGSDDFVFVLDPVFHIVFGHIQDVVVDRVDLLNGKGNLIILSLDLQ